MRADRPALLAVPPAAALLLWPAIWNRYPIVSADTGTYLSQAIQHYVGWDRPVFYSVFMLPLHATVTVWPVIVAQALLAAWVLWSVSRMLVPDISAGSFVAGAGLLSVLTWLPWIVSELMPDLFTPLLILLLCLLIWRPDLQPWRQQIVLAGLAAFMIGTQQSSLPLACVLAVALALTRLAGPRTANYLLAESRPGECPPAGIGKALAMLAGRARLGWGFVALPPVLAVLALCSVNLAAHGRFAVSPFGNIFLLARIIYDGPGMAVLRRDCPTTNWRLCPFLDDFPPTSDDFLWTHDSPLNRAGGPKAVSKDAGAIIAAAVLADPVGEIRAAMANTLEQINRFESGDGLNPWPTQVSPWIERDFPAREQAAYASARQQLGGLSVPPPLGRLHVITALIGVLGCAILLPIAIRRRAACAGFLLAVLLALPVSAAITGALSAPHDRYQARIMWLPPFIAVLSFASLRRRAALGVNVFWSGLEAGISAVLSIVTSFLVARIVGPAEFGIGAAATAVHVILWVVVNALFADALVQRPAVNDRMLSSAFWASAGVGCLAMLLQGAAGIGLARILQDHRLVPMGLLLAMPLPLVGAAGVVQGLLTRERAYRRLALRTLIGQGLGTAVGVSAAFAGAGGWALVYQQAVTTSCGALALLVARGWRPARWLDWTAVHSLLRVGLPLTASTLVLIGRYRLFAVLIGGAAGAAVLGQVHIAFRLVDTVRELIFTALWRLMLPVLSEHQHDRSAMLAQVDHWLRRCAVVILPLCLLLGIGLTHGVVLLMGSRWAATGNAAVPLVVLMAWSTLSFPSGVALIAAGHARLTLYANLAGLLASSASVLLLRPTEPWTAVMIWTISQIAVSPYSLWMNGRSLGVGMIRPLTGGLGFRAAA